MSHEIVIKGEGVTGPKMAQSKVFQAASVAFGAVSVPIDLRPFAGQFVSIQCWPNAMHYAIAATGAELAAINPAFTGSGPGECVYMSPGSNTHRFMLRPGDNFIAATPSVAATSSQLVVWVSSDRHGGVPVTFP